MEDLEAAPGSPALQDRQEPEGLDDPDDPLQPGIEEEDRPNAPLGDPTADVDAFEDEEAPETAAAMNEREESQDRGERASVHDSGDEDSELEELDEAQFDDFDAANLNIPDVPTQVDESNVGLLGVHKRKRTEEEQEEARKRKKKEKRREKPKRERKRREQEEDFEGGEEVDGKRRGKGGAPKPRRARTPEDEENLTPEERRRRALDRKMDEAVKSHRAGRSRKGGIDLEAAADAEIESMRHRMAKACEADSDARARGEVATHKLRILPEVVELMNRNTIQTQLVDPDTNLLEAVRFMLEPADQDAALPNYQIQRELFAILQKLHIGKEALLASGIGKVIMFYTKSSQPETGIKHAAERLLAEWMRTVLGKQKTMRHRPVQQRTYDPSTAQQTAGSRASARSAADLAEEKRRRVLAAPAPANRARVEGAAGTYTVAPVSNLSNAMGVRRAGQAGEEAFRRIQARAKAGEKK